MTDTLYTAIIQTHLVWENAVANRKNLDALLNEVPEETQLAILPEMFTSGFTMNAAQVAEPMTGTTVSWMKALAATHDIAITGSLVIEDNGHYYNRLVFVSPKGVEGFYNKRHTFTLVGEDEVYHAGDEKWIVTYKGWKLCPLICYDLRFPVWARNVEDYDVFYKHVFIFYFK